MCWCIHKTLNLKSENMLENNALRKQHKTWVIKISEQDSLSYGV